MNVNPTGADLKRLLAEDDGRPVVMLNLLRFTPSGRASYEQYVREIAPCLTRVGGRVVHIGDMSTALVAPDGFAWDVVLLVEYPNRTAFSRMVADREYQRITHLRTEALSAAVLQPTLPW